jgi:hypothetical protein
MRKIMGELKKDKKKSRSENKTNQLKTNMDLWGIDRPVRRQNIKLRKKEQNDCGLAQAYIDRQARENNER